MNCTRRWFALLCAILATVALTLGPSAIPASAAVTCTISTAQGTCGPYNHYAKITGSLGNITVGNDVWSPTPGWQQTITSVNPGDWSVTASVPDHSGQGVTSYPNVGVSYGQNVSPWDSTPLSNFSAIQSTFSEQLQSAPNIIAEAAYDIWGGEDNSPDDDWNYEVMIQNDYSVGGPQRCDADMIAASAEFSGQTWDLCPLGSGPGSELIWFLPQNESSGTVHVEAMLKWLITNDYLPANYGLTAVGYGAEFASTGGQPATFSVSRFGIHATCVPGAVC